MDIFLRYFVLGVGRFWKTCGFALVGVLAFPCALLASSDANGMADRMSELALQVGAIIIAARLCGMLFKKLNLPGVIGEMFAGILIGPYVLGHIPLPGFPEGLFPIASQSLPVSEPLYAIATVASIILLFIAGIETDFALLLKFSVASFWVGIGGVIASFGTGMALCHIMTDLPLFHPTSLFLGVVSTATSVGITARILTDKKRLDTPEGVTILGAAVIDDIVGVILLAVIVSFVSLSAGAGEGVDWLQIGYVALRATGIFLVFTLLGLKFARQIAFVLKKCENLTAMSVMAFALALILAGFFEKAGLALIIGGYVAGLALSLTDIRRVIQEQLRGVHAFFVPVFFAVMGMLINIQTMFSPEVITFGLLFTVVAFLAKYLGCGIPAFLSGFNMLGATRIGLGMVPRGEVALIVAGIGLSSGVLADEFFAVSIFMTVFTTIFTPMVLTVVLSRPERGTRTEIDISGHVSFSFDLGRAELASFVENHIVEEFRLEGFYVHLLDGDVHQYHIQRDQSVIVLSIDKQKIQVDTSAEFLVYAKTLVYESIVELHSVTDTLRDVIKIDQLKRDIAPSAFTQTEIKQPDVAQIVSQAHILTNLKADTGEGVMREIVDALGQTCVSDPEGVVAALMERERLVSTAMEYGVAIPHARTPAVNGCCLAIGFKRGGIHFGATDAFPTEVFACILYPANTEGPHMALLAYLAEKLSSREKVQQVLSCASEEAVLRFLLTNERVHNTGNA